MTNLNKTSDDLFKAGKKMTSGCLGLVLLFFIILIVLAIL